MVNFGDYRGELAEVVRAADSAVTVELDWTARLNVPSVLVVPSQPWVIGEGEELAFGEVLVHVDCVCVVDHASSASLPALERLVSKVIGAGLSDEWELVSVEVPGTVNASTKLLATTVTFRKATRLRGR